MTLKTRIARLEAREPKQKNPLVKYVELEKAFSAGAGHVFYGSESWRQADWEAIRDRALEEVAAWTKRFGPLKAPPEPMKVYLADVGWDIDDA